MTTQPPRAGSPPPRSDGVDAASRPLRGRGSRRNPTGRFERLASVADEETVESDRRERTAREERPRGPATLYLRDPTRRALSTNDSPDLAFDTSLNPYRGCEHGCAYCYARPTHEYLGFSAGLDFETRILVKQRLPELLRRELAAPRWKPRVIAMSGVTDAWQPIERKLGISRRCLEVLADFRNPVSVITKNALVLRDRDCLARLAEHGAAAVQLSVTSLDAELQRALEPRASHPDERLRAIEGLARAGIPVGVILGPVIPGLTDHEIPRIIEAAASAGASWASHIVLRLPHGVADLFADWLETHRPERRRRVLAQVRELRGGTLYDARFGARLRGEGIRAQQVADLVALVRRRRGLAAAPPDLNAAAFRRPGGEQLSLL